MIKSKSRFFFIPFIAIFFCSCAHFKTPHSVTYVLNRSGENRPQLEKVLRKYSWFKKDSLRFKAACYLIENIPGHYGIYHRNSKCSDAVYENVVRSLLQGVDTAFLRKAQQGFKMPPSQANNAYIKADINTVTSRLLISDIERSFYAWEHYPWCKNMDFEKFEKYILPYRTDKEPLSDLREYFQKKFSWLVDSMGNSDNMKKAFEYVYHSIYDPKIGWEYGKVGDLRSIMSLYDCGCYDKCLFVNIIMKSMGIVSAFEATPHWANRSSDHYWISYVDKNGKPLVIDRCKKLMHPVYLPSALFDSLTPYSRFLPKDIENLPAKKGAKVYRITFRPNSHSIYYNNLLNEPIPAEVNDLFREDVTGDYLKCSDIVTNLLNDVGKKLVYLCIFDRGQVVPVAWALADGHRAVFKSVGIGVLYLVTLCDGKGYSPFSLPFILYNDGNIRVFDTKCDPVQTMVVKRKYPLFGNILGCANEMYKARIQGSNHADFSDAVDLYTIDTTFLLPTIVKIHNKERFRYYRYLSAAKSTGDIGELAFMYGSDGQLKKAQGRSIFKYLGPEMRNYAKAFDDKLETFYKSDTAGTWIGIDLGQEKENWKRVVAVKVSPRTDTDFIIPGNLYELFFWNNGWKSLGKKTAKDYSLVYHKVPKGALFWLHCISGGKEERPFTYENGKQVWW